jgi:predicted acetyltransferase
VYEEFNATRNMTAVRTPEYWSGWALGRLGGGESVLVAENEGMLVGYLVFSADEGNCWLREIGYLPGSADSLIRQAVTNARDLGAETLWCYLPDTPEVRRVVNQVANRVEAREYSGMMFRMINMESLGQRILPEMEKRAIGLPCISLSLDTDFGSLVLTVKNGHVSNEPDNPIHIPVDQRCLFSLIFGFKTCDDLQIAVSAEVRQTLSALFPPQHSLLSQVDYF